MKVLLEAFPQWPIPRCTGTMAILMLLLKSCSLGVHDNNSIEEQTAQIESLLLYGEIQKSLWMFVYKISAPPKEFPSINGNCFPDNLTKNPSSKYQAQGAFFGETIVKLYVKYKAISINRWKFFWGCTNLVHKHLRRLLNFSIQQ